MALGEFGALAVVYLFCVSFVLWLTYLEFRRVKFNFNVLFSLLFLLTFYFGFPFTAMLIFRFDVGFVGVDYLLYALLAATGFYGIYYLTYKTRVFRRQASAPAPRPLLTVTRVEAHLIWMMMALIAIGTLSIFLMQNGLLLFKLEKYSQIFSSQVSGVALKRFFYFFIPAMLVVYFIRPTKMNWLFFLATTLTFGVLSYVVVGGTRANIVLAFALFLFIGIVQGYISLGTLIVAGCVGVLAMFALALRRYNLDVAGAEAFYTFLYLTRDTFSPWENLALLLKHYENIEFQGLAPIARDFYVFIPQWMWPERPSQILNSANYFTWEVLDNHSGLAISPTLIGSAVVMGGVAAIPIAAIAVGLIIKWFDWLYAQGRKEVNRYKGAVMQAFCFGAIFNLIVLAREGFDAFCSRILFYIVVFAFCILVAKLCYWLFQTAGLLSSRVRKAYAQTSVNRY